MFSPRTIMIRPPDGGAALWHVNTPAAGIAANAFFGAELTAELWQDAAILATRTLTTATLTNTLAEYVFALTYDERLALQDVDAFPLTLIFRGESSGVEIDAASVLLEPGGVAVPVTDTSAIQRAAFFAVF